MTFRKLVHYGSIVIIALVAVVTPPRKASAASSGPECPFGDRYVCTFGVGDCDPYFGEYELCYAVERWCNTYNGSPPVMVERICYYDTSATECYEHLCEDVPEG
jgi:hypothetical protein